MCKTVVRSALPFSSSSSFFFFFFFFFAWRTCHCNIEIPLLDIVEAHKVNTNCVANTQSRRL